MREALYKSNNAYRRNDLKQINSLARNDIRRYEPLLDPVRTAWGRRAHVTWTHPAFSHFEPHHSISHVFVGKEEGEDTKRRY